MLSTMFDGFNEKLFGENLATCLLARAIYIVQAVNEYL